MARRGALILLLAALLALPAAPAGAAPPPSNPNYAPFTATCGGVEFRLVQLGPSAGAVAFVGDSSEPVVALTVSVYKGGELVYASQNRIGAGLEGRTFVCEVTPDPDTRVILEAFLPRG